MCSKWDLFFCSYKFISCFFHLHVEVQGDKTKLCSDVISDQEQLGVREEMKAKFQIIIDGLYHFGWSNHNNLQAFFRALPKLRAWPVQKVRSLGQMHNCTLVRTFDWNHYTLIHRLHLLKSWYPKLCPTSHRKIMMLHIIYSGSIRCVLQQYQSIVIPTHPL